MVLGQQANTTFDVERQFDNLVLVHLLQAAHGGVNIKPEAPQQLQQENPGACRGHVLSIAGWGKGAGSVLKRPASTPPSSPSNVG